MILSVGTFAAAQSVPGLRAASTTRSTPEPGVQSGAPAADTVTAPHQVLFNLYQTPVMTVFIAGADGADARALVPDLGLEYSPAFSPDGQWVVFTAEPDGQADLYRIRPDGTGLERLTDHPAFDDQGALSPDGRTLAFVSTPGAGHRGHLAARPRLEDGLEPDRPPVGQLPAPLVARRGVDRVHVGPGRRARGPARHVGAPAVHRRLRRPAGRHGPAPRHRPGRGGGQPVVVAGRPAPAVLRDRPRRRLPREERPVPHRARLGGRRHRRARPAHRLAGDEAVAGLALRGAHRLREPRRGRPGRPENPPSRPPGRDGHRGGGAQPELVTGRRAGGLRAHRAARLHPAQGARLQPRPRVPALPARAVRVVLAGRRQHDLQRVPRSVLGRHRARVVEPQRLEPRDHVRGRVPPADALPPRGDQRVLRRLVRRPATRSSSPSAATSGAPASRRPRWRSSIPMAPTCGWSWTTR